MLFKYGRMTRGFIRKNVVVNMVVVNDIASEVVCNVGVLIDNALR